MLYGGRQRELRSPSVGYDKNLISGLFSNQCSSFEGKSDVANTLLARDYKGFGNQRMNGVVECKKT